MGNKLHLKWLPGNGIAAILLLLASAHTGAREVFSLVDGNDGNGLWLSAQVWLNDDVPDDAVVKNAVVANNRFVALSDAKQVKPAMIAGGKSGKDLAKTPALLPLDATDVAYKAFWRWGDNALLDVSYQLPKRLIPWRSDYQCGQTPGCQLLTQPQTQFFELSYFQYKQNQAKTIARSEFTKKTPSQSAYHVLWSDPDNRPDYSGAEAAPDSSDLQWTLKLSPLTATLIWKQGEIVVQGDDEKKQAPAIVSLFSRTVNRMLAKERFERGLAEESGPTEQYVQPIANNGYGYFVRYVDEGNGKQQSRRLVYQEQLVEMVTNWQEVDVVGSLELANRGFLFIQPTVLVEQGDTAVLQKSAVTVFEYQLDGPLTMELGVKADWIGALLSNDYLLEAIRKQS
ncbi:hypothetical protein [Alteromonas halophila]|uniref:Uncharacterized protein n=1 Tax=Alteromonas halophila TaxID=516698 RepID=A0A918JTD2_9ALTE|nr:hypothetical protein [Alteromonas halophila]GGW96874.1 hypothetical protein GCM10007391_33690 [Alteromonas halophila]